MKNTLSIILVILVYAVLTQAFQCGGRYPIDNCGVFNQDTILLTVAISNPLPTYRVNDTIKLFSKVSDTLKSKGGKTFIKELTTLYAFINTYKLAQGSSSQLNYANNEFNATLPIGMFQNFGGTGLQILYQRDKPFNTFSLNLIPGRVGIFLVDITTTSNGYGNYISDQADICTSYSAGANIAVAQQQRQFWDSLGTSSLSIGNSNYPHVVKNHSNYFFFKIIP